ncbi:MAG: leucine-rich repeat protein [Clostridia bacterium]|nr:leucine-rich repeat protein [Clostridia bacterium]
MLKRLLTVIFALCLAAVFCAAGAETLKTDGDPRISLVTATAVEGQDFVFDVVYENHDPVIMTIRIIKDGVEEQSDRATSTYRCTIPAEEFVHYEEGPFTLEVRVYDNTSGQSFDLTATSSYARPNPITAAPRLISNENGKAVIYYPDAERFIMDTGRIIWPEDGMAELTRGNNADGRYAAVVNGRRTAWLNVVIAEEVELPEMEDWVYLDVADSYPRGEPITFTVSGDPKARYTYFLEQAGCFYASGTLPGPGTHTMDWGCLSVEGNGSYFDTGRVDLYVTAYREGYSPSSDAKSFQISENVVPSAPTVTILTPEPWYINQPIRFRINKANATAYCSLTESNGAIWVNLVDQECELRFKTDYDSGMTVAFAAKVNGLWSEYTETIYLDLEEYEGSLSKPAVRAPMFGLTGSSVTVRWNAVTGADRYTVYAYYDNSYERFEREVTGTSASIPVLCGGNDTMWIIVTASGKGYMDVNSDWTSVRIRKSTGTLSLPSSLTAIEKDAFNGGKFSCVIVPSGCESIGAYAFANTKNLVKARIPASVTTIADKAFEGSGICVIETTANSAAEAFAISHQIPVDYIR